MESDETFNAPRSAGGDPLFDLDAYFMRINYSGSREVSIATLKGLHFAHAHHVPFENLDIHLGKALSLKPEDLFAKIVSRRRGGYCYEVNSFFAMVLQTMGFQVHGLLARVLFNLSAIYPRSHQLLLVEVDHQPWIADVGFGSCCLREPLPLVAGVINEQGPDTFRLREEPGPNYTLEALLAGRWQDLYTFTLERYLLVDYEPYNFYNSTSPNVKWTQQRICTIPTRDGRVVAVDDEFKIYSPEGLKTIQANTDEEYLHLLRQYFSLEIAGTFLK